MTTLFRLTLLLATLFTVVFAGPHWRHQQSWSPKDVDRWWKNRPPSRNPFKRWEVKFWPGNDCNDRSDMTYYVGSGPLYDCTPVPSAHDTPSAFMVSVLVQNYTFNFYEGEHCEGDKPAASWSTGTGSKGKCYPPPNSETKYRSFKVTKSDSR